MTDLRYAVLSDIHGNIPALDAVLSHAAAQRPSGFVVAGDFVGGPDADGVFARLQQYAETSIAGNNEEYLLAFQSQSVTPEQQHSAQWAFARACFRRIGAAAMRRVTDLPAQLVLAPQHAAPVRVVHGSTRSSTEALYPEPKTTRLREVLDGIEEAAFVCGHTHESWQFSHNGCLAFNPGSVGGACNGDARAQYAMLAWNGAAWEVEHHAVSYDMADVQRIYLASGFLHDAGPMARAQLEGILTADHTVSHLVRHAFETARAQGLGKVACVPDYVWEEAVATFDWKLPPPA